MRNYLNIKYKNVDEKVPTKQTVENSNINYFYYQNLSLRMGRETLLVLDNATNILPDYIIQKLQQKDNSIQLKFQNIDLDCYKYIGCLLQNTSLLIFF